MSGRGESGGGDREDERAFLAPGRGGDGGGGNGDDDRRDRMPGCLGFFIGWRKKRATASARVASASLPPPPPPPGSQDTQHDSSVDSSEVAGSGSDSSKDIAVQVITALPAEIDCLIVSKLPSIFDRSSLQAVCGRWRNAAVNCMTAPLPLIINAEYTISNYFAEGPECVPQNMNPRVQHPHGLVSTALGCLDNWAVYGYESMFDPQANLDLVHNECYLFQPIKGVVIRLPSPSSFRCKGLSGSLQIVYGNGSLTFAPPTKQCRVRLQKASVFRTPGHVNFKVAALATQRGQHQLLFSTPISETWTIASAPFVTIGSDIEFLQEKLFILGNNQATLFVIEFGPHLCMFPTPSHVQMYSDVDTHVVENTIQQKNLVRDGEMLLLVVRYLNPGFDQLTAVRLYEMNANSSPISWKEKQSLGAKTILISLNSSICFHTPPNTDIRSDHIYFLDQFCPHFLPVDNEQFSYRSQMYSLKSREISENLIGREPASRRPGFPMWFCPSA